MYKYIYNIMYQVYNRKDPDSFSYSTISYCKINSFCFLNGSLFKDDCAFLC